MKVFVLNVKEKCLQNYFVTFVTLDNNVIAVLVNHYQNFKRAILAINSSKFLYNKVNLVVYVGKMRKIW